MQAFTILSLLIAGLAAVSCSGYSSGAYVNPSSGKNVNKYLRYINGANVYPGSGYVYGRGMSQGDDSSDSDDSNDNNSDEVPNNNVYRQMMGLNASPYAGSYMNGRQKDGYIYSYVNSRLFGGDTDVDYYRQGSNSSSISPYLYRNENGRQVNYRPHYYPYGPMDYRYNSYKKHIDNDSDSSSSDSSDENSNKKFKRIKKAIKKVIKKFNKKKNNVKSKYPSYGNYPKEFLPKDYPNRYYPKNYPNYYRRLYSQ